MNKSKIDWCDYTWNPVTGCLHECSYCYARQIANRFGLEFAPKIGDPGFHGCKYDSSEGIDTMAELDKPYYKGGKIQPYPLAFYPTFHRYKLEEPTKKTKPVTIFVGSMSDLFGDWIPDEWIEEIFNVNDIANQHNYLFLTKNPKRYDKFLDYYMGEERGGEEEYAFCDNLWFGATITQHSEIEREYILSEVEEGHRFLSLEPLYSHITLNLKHDRCPKCGSAHIYQDNPNTAMGLPSYYCDCCGEWEGEDDTELRSSIDWVIIGAETGNRKDKIIPERSWIEDIVNECQVAGVPIFMKSNLEAVWGKDLIQEYPEGLKKGIE